MAYYFITIITALILDSVLLGPSSNGRSKAKQMIPKNKKLCDNGEALKIERGWVWMGGQVGRNGEGKKKGNCNQVLCEKNLFNKRKKK